MTDLTAVESAEAAKLITPPGLPRSVEDYRELEREMESLDGDRYLEFLRFWGERDFFFFMLYILSTRDWIDKETGLQKFRHPFVFERCRDTQFDEAGVLEIWSREHLKSTIKSYGRPIHRLIENLPQSAELTQVIISFTKGLSRKFLSRCAREMETNKLLPKLWPEVFWDNPRKESPRWKLTDDPNPQLEVKRKTNVSEATIESIGLIEGFQPGPHWDCLCYDDIVTLDSIANEDMIRKTDQRYRASLSLGREGGLETFAGTFYLDLGDQYHTLIKEGKRCRVIPCWQGPADRKVSVFYSVDYLVKKRGDLGDTEFGIQWECRPAAGRRNKLKIEWLRYYKPEDLLGSKDEFGKPVPGFHASATGYMLVDAAKSDAKNVRSDFTSIQYWDVLKTGQRALVDLVRDRLNPTERMEAILEMHEKWDNGHFIHCRYETYGMDEGIHHLEKFMLRRGYVFDVIRVGGVPRARGFKQRRIEERLQPLFQRGDIILPERLVRACNYRGGAMVDLIEVFRQEEYLVYPLCQHDDILDCMSRLEEPGMPLIVGDSSFGRKNRPDRWARAAQRADAARRKGNWMAPSI